MLKRFLAICLIALLAMPAALAETPEVAEPMEILSFRMAPENMQPGELEVYPYIGLTVAVPEALREMIKTGSVYMTNEYELAFDDEAFGETGMMNVDADAFERMHVAHAAIAFYYIPEALRSQTPYTDSADAIFAMEDYEPWRDQLIALGRLDIGSQAEAQGAQYAVIAEKNGFAYIAWHAGEIPTDADAAKAHALVGEALAAIEVGEARPIDEKFYSAFTPQEKQIDAIGAFAAQNLAGEPVTEAIFADAKLTLVNIWTTWCGPCIQEIPDLSALAEELSAQGVQIVGIVQDAYDASAGVIDEDAREEAIAICDAAGVVYPMIVPDAALSEGILEGLLGFPTSYFVDAEGNVLGESLLGSCSKEEWQAILLEKLAEVDG